jgi:hypothetical protein
MERATVDAKNSVPEPCDKQRHTETLVRNPGSRRVIAGQFQRSWLACMGRSADQDLAYTQGTDAGIPAPARYVYDHTTADRRDFMQITKIETFTYWIKWCNLLFVKVSAELMAAARNERRRGKQMG